MTLAPLIVMTLTGIMSVILMANAFAFDGARWRAGEALAGAGIGPEAIDAGVEWMGFHSITPARYVNAPPANPIYRGWWPGTAVCGLVTATADPPPQGRLIGVEPYRLYLVAGPTVTLYLYALESPACPTGQEAAART